ncbi:MAG: DUF5666 domain-containing protein [Patescibacteria group bacterium]|jgi:hypothetical protein
MKNQNLIIGLIIAFLVVMAGSFYGGMIYGKNQAGNGFGGQFQNLTPEQRQARMQGLQQGNSAMARRGNGQGGGFAAGEIINKDDKSITIKLPAGGSKIILFSDSTSVGKFENGAAADLAIGQTVTASGTTNSDGSVTATQIQIRPADQQPSGQTPPAQTPPPTK